jgi:hypothetical protein
VIVVTIQNSFRLEIIFDINISKQSENIKKKIHFKKKIKILRKMIYIVIQTHF